MNSPFGSGGFGQTAEAFARYFGTPSVLIGQVQQLTSRIDTLTREIHTKVVSAR